MRFPLSLAVLPLAFARPHASVATFASEVIFAPPSNYTIPRVLYARTAQFENGDLLATWENYSPEPPPVYFPIYKSSDAGQSWQKLSEAHDTANGFGLRYQPFLYVLPESFADWPAGTVLLSGNSIPEDLSTTQIDLYASTDAGWTWEFVSHIAAGGRAEPTNGLTPVWEPFLMLHENKLICYYSDQRDNATHGQKLVHQTTEDGKTWGPVINDVVYPTYTDRPGMTTVARLPDGRFIMTYEYGGNSLSANYSFPVSFRISADPEDFASASSSYVNSTDGTIPDGSPYVVWSSVGGDNGTIIVSSGGAPEIFTNTALGEGSWNKIATEEPTSYSRHLRVLNQDPARLLLIGGGALPPSTTNKITDTVMDMSGM